MSIEVRQRQLVCTISLAMAVLRAGDLVAAELTREQLMSEVVGSTIQYQNGADTLLEFIAPDGAIHGMSTLHGRYQARWRFLDDTSICFEHDDPMASGCVAVVLHDGLIEYHRKDGVVAGPFPLLQGNPERL